MTKKPKRERFLLRIARCRQLPPETAVLIPCDEWTRARMRRKGYGFGDELSADLRKSRNPGYHRLMHVFAQMLVDNIEDFSGMEPHAVLKRLQWECNIACDEMGVQVPGAGYALIRIPRSMSFDEMDQGEVEEIYKAMCHRTSEKYWPDLSPEQVAQMAEVMPQAA